MRGAAMRVLRVLMVVLFSAVSVCGQTKTKASLRLEQERMRKECKEAAIREGQLLHLLMRQALGLKIDAEEFFALTQADRGMSTEDGEAILEEVRKDVRLRAEQYQELDALVASKPKKPAKTESGPQRREAANPTVKEMPKPKPKPRLLPLPPLPPEGLESADPTQETNPPGKRVVTIKGSPNQSAVGRILFKAGHYEQAAGELATLKDGEVASLQDLFFLALCYEKIHTAFQVQADAANAAAAAARSKSGAANKAAEVLELEGKSKRSTGGSQETVATYERLKQEGADAAKEAKKYAEEGIKHTAEAAKLHDKAYAIFEEIEERDIQTGEDGNKVTGKWAEASRAARSGMIWLEGNRKWNPPEISWRNQ